MLMHTAHGSLSLIHLMYKTLFFRLVMATPYTISPFAEKMKINISPYLPDEEVVDGDSSDEEGNEAVSAKV